MSANKPSKLSWWQKKKRSIIKRLLIDFVNSSDSYVIQHLPEFLLKTDIELSELRGHWIHQNKDNNDKDLINKFLSSEIGKNSTSFQDLKINF